MTDLIDRPESKVSERFRVMADLIDRNVNSTFGGAVVIIPPPEGGDPIEMLMLDVTADAGQFWSTIKTRIEIKLNQMDEKARAQAAFGGHALRR